MLGDYAFENPLSKGELALAFVSGGLWYAATDFLARFIATKAIASGQANGDIPTDATGSGKSNVSNDVAVLKNPTLLGFAAQAGMTAVPGIGAAFVHGSMARATLQGMMIGGGIHLVADVFKMLMVKVLHDKPIGARLYLPEIEANDKFTANNAASASPTPGLTGVPNQRALAARNYAAVGPRAMTRGVGAPRPMGVSNGVPQPIPTQPGVSPQGQGACGEGCGGCGDGGVEKGIARTLNQVMPPPTPDQVAQGLTDTLATASCSTGMGAAPYQMFPDD